MTADGPSAMVVRSDATPPYPMAATLACAYLSAPLSPSVAALDGARHLVLPSPFAATVAGAWVHKTAVCSYPGRGRRQPCRPGPSSGRRRGGRKPRSTAAPNRLSCGR